LVLAGFVRGWERGMNGTLAEHIQVLEEKLNSMSAAIMLQNDSANKTTLR
jgi:hypothetical protein